VPRGKPLDYEATHWFHKQLESALPSCLWKVLERAGVNQHHAGSFVQFESGTLLEFDSSVPIEAIIARICLEAP
jgi:hypothetical protein